MVKTTKGGKTMNPTDAYRKDIRKKELKRNKKERKKVREVGILKKDPESLRDQIQKLEAMKADGALDKARKHKKRQLEDTLNLVMKKRKEFEDKAKEKGETPVMFSHLGPLRRRTTAEEEERVNHPSPEDSVYYHPTLNPSGAPPPGKPPMFKSSIGPRIPLPEASASNAESSSKPESENAALSALPFPLPPPPLLISDLDSGDGSVVPAGFPLPPPPPMPPLPANTEVTTILPPPPLPPPPPPGPPPKELLAVRPPPQSEKPAKSDDSATVNSNQMPAVLPPPPTLPVLSSKSGNNQPESSYSECVIKATAEGKDFLNMVPPPPSMRQQPLVPGAPMHPNFQPDLPPPGLLCFSPPLPPPPPPNDMLLPLSTPGITGQPVPPGVMVPLLRMPPFGPPPGPPLMMRPPLPPGPPPIAQDGFVGRMSTPQKPSYIKSAASTVVKKPLAQHTPELTAMIPASVRVRRESALSKPKSKSSAVLPTNRPIASPTTKQESITSSSATKPQSIDDSYTAFLEDMKALGALDS